MTKHMEEVEADMGKLLSKIPFAFIGVAITLLVQFAVIISWGAKLENRVSAIETANIQNAAMIENLKVQTSTVNVSLARLQERQAGQTEDLREIKELVKDLSKK